MKNGFYGKSLRTEIIISILIFLCSLFGMWLLDLYRMFFDTHKVLLPISIPANFKIDFFGAIFPLFVSLVCVAVYFKNGFSKINYVPCFLFSLAIAFSIGQVTPEGLMSSPSIFSISVSIIVVSLVTFFRKLSKKPIWEFKGSYIASLLIVTSCSPISKIIVDLYYVGVGTFGNPVIGGNGLADGVLLSTMYSPLAVTFITSFLVSLLLIYRREKK